MTCIHPNERNRPNERADPNDSDLDLPIGVRRSKREPCQPLKWWKNEHRTWRRPREGEVPVPQLDAIIRLPEDDVGPLRSKSRKRRGTTRPPSARPQSKARETYADVDPEEGWDAETEETAVVMDFETKEQIKKGLHSHRLCLD